MTIQDGAIAKQLVAHRFSIFVCLDRVIRGRSRRARLEPLSSCAREHPLAHSRTTTVMSRLRARIFDVSTRVFELSDRQPRAFFTSMRRDASQSSTREGMTTARRLEIRYAFYDSASLPSCMCSHFMANTKSMSTVFIKKFSRQKIENEDDENHIKLIAAFTMCSTVMPNSL